MNSLIQDNLACIHQGIDLLGRLDAEAYTRPQPECFSSTVGGHMRHNVDHYQSLLSGVGERVIDYDARLRDPDVEREPARALERLQEIAQGLQGLGNESGETVLRVKMDSGGDEPERCWSQSTTRRELQFLLSHTIHHYALIAVICQLRGIPVDPAFGVAPSTLKHQQHAG